jgi:predicted nucleotidyltransferase
MMKKKIRYLIHALVPYEPERIYLFGSWARGEADELSDLDAVVIKSTPEPFLDRLRTVGCLLPMDLGGVDLLVYTPAEFARMRREGNAFVEMIAEKGVIVYDRTAQDSFAAAERIFAAVRNCFKNAGADDVISPEEG